MPKTKQRIPNREHQTLDSEQANTCTMKAAASSPGEPAPGYFAASADKKRWASPEQRSSPARRITSAPAAGHRPSRSAGEELRLRSEPQMAVKRVCTESCMWHVVVPHMHTKISIPNPYHAIGYIPHNSRFIDTRWGIYPTTADLSTRFNSILIQYDPIEREHPPNTSCIMSLDNRVYSRKCLYIL